MIARIEGMLETIADGHALVRLPGGITAEVLLPAFSVARLGGYIDEHVSLYTFMFFESQGQGATMLPRLAGFESIEDRRFYSLFTTCKGIGQRRALRAMTLATPQIAAAIEQRDLALLQSLPEIGKRTAETVVATLRGKVEHLLTPGSTAAADGEHAGTPPAASGVGLAREAVDALVGLGERRPDAAQWVDQILARDTSPPPEDVSSLLAEVYAIKANSGR